MMLNIPGVSPEDIKAEVDSGLSFTCAMCLKYWRQRRRVEAAGKKFDGKCEAAVRKLECSGPMSAGTFQEYEGPFTDLLRAQMCFRCGEPADVGLKVRSTGQFIGVCQTHFDEIGLWRRNDAKPGQYRTAHDLKLDKREF